MNTTVSAFCLDHLSNDDLLAGMRAQVGRSNQVLAGLLAHLAEVDARGLYRLRACSSLSTYCVYEFRMSEDAAQRRVQAAKIARRFPVLFEQIAAGQIHLTAVLMLGPHLTDANHLEVLALAKHRTKREIAGLVRRLDPLPDVPARIEPLGPAARGNPLQSGTHAQFAAALAGPVRELPPGDRPSDWLEDGGEGAASAELLPEPDRALATTEQPAGEEPPADERQDESSSARELLLAPQRYKVQFTASQEYVDLLERALDLLTPAVSRRDLEQVHLRALRLLVAELKKRKYAVTDRSRSASRPDDPHRRGLKRRGLKRRGLKRRGLKRRRPHPKPRTRSVRASAADPASARRSKRTRDRDLHAPQASFKLAQFRRRCAVRSPSAISTAALTWTTGDTGVGKPVVSSFTTSTPTRSEDRRRRRILLFAARPTMLSPPSRTMAVSSWRAGWLEHPRRRGASDLTPPALPVIQARASCIRIHVAAGWWITGSAFAPVEMDPGGTAGHTGVLPNRTQRTLTVFPQLPGSPNVHTAPRFRAEPTNQEAGAIGPSPNPMRLFSQLSSLTEQILDGVSVRRHLLDLGRSLLGTSTGGIKFAADRWMTFRTLLGRRFG